MTKMSPETLTITCGSQGSFAWEWMDSQKNILIKKKG